MGQAKLRGSFADRKTLAIKTNQERDIQRAKDRALEEMQMTGEQRANRRKVQTLLTALMVATSSSNYASPVSSKSPFSRS